MLQDRESMLSFGHIEIYKIENQLKEKAVNRFGVKCTDIDITVDGSCDRKMNVCKEMKKCDY